MLDACSSAIWQRCNPAYRVLREEAKSKHLPNGRDRLRPSSPRATPRLVEPGSPSRRGPAPHGGSGERQTERPTSDVNFHRRMPETPDEARYGAPAAGDSPSFARAAPNSAWKRSGTAGRLAVHHAWIARTSQPLCPAILHALDQDDRDHRGRGPVAEPGPESRRGGGPDRAARDEPEVADVEVLERAGAGRVLIEPLPLPRLTAARSGSRCRSPRRWSGSRRHSRARRGRASRTGSRAARDPRRSPCPPCRSARSSPGRGR